MRNKYKISNNTAVEIRETIKEYRKTIAYSKLQVIMLAGEGVKYSEIATITGYHYNHVKILIKEYCTSTFEEFVTDKRKGGNRRNITEEKEQEILNKFKKQAEIGQIITPKAIKEEYDKIVGKETKISTFYDFLHRNKWRKVKPRGEHPKKASDEDIEASKKLKLVWRMLKNIMYLPAMERLE